MPTANGEAMADHENEPNITDLSEEAKAVAPSGKGSGNKPRVPVRIVTDLPGKVPVMPETVAVIIAYLGQLAAELGANDNEPE
jgi:hypothetical protein